MKNFTKIISLITALSLLLTACSTPKFFASKNNGAATNIVNNTTSSNGTSYQGNVGTIVPEGEPLANRADVQAFINEMVNKHNMDRQWLQNAFSRSYSRSRIIATMNRPAEGVKPWYSYRNIFFDAAGKRVNGGAKFWRENRAALERAEAQYGVDPAVIVAIIGVETMYGGNKGKDRVIDALSTLAFDYPRRAPFFRSELEAFLILAREEQIDPLMPVGSYAGAMGIPQFMPSSYRAYAVDFNRDGHRNIWNDPTDAIGSVANYLAKHGWKRGAPVAALANVSGSSYSQYLGDRKNMKPKFALGSMIGISAAAPANEQTILLGFELESGATEYWACFTNFYTISRYNHSPLYSMAVYQLSQAIRERISL